VVAISVKIVATPQFSWVTIAVFSIFTFYFITRTYLKIGSLTAFAFESCLVLPAAVWVLCHDSSWHGEMWLLIGVGLCAMAAMTFYVAASSLLPMPVFGLLSYVEPVLLVGAALLLGERMTPAEVVVYAILACALGLLAVAGFRDARRLPEGNM